MRIQFSGIINAWQGKNKLNVSLLKKYDPRRKSLMEILDQSYEEYFFGMLLKLFFKKNNSNS